MKKIHVVIPDLFLPQQLAAYASGDLRLPALEKVLARARVEARHTDTLERWLCEHFGVDDMAIAPLTLLADGVQPGESYWLRADPVGISMQRDQTILQADIALTAEEAAQLCASLNAHFAADGLHFVAPHPQRWYLQLEQVPALQTHPLPQVVGADIHAHLPSGGDALRWHSVFNEIQMLFYEHAVNQAREQRGELPVSGVWLWGGGKAAKDLGRAFACVAGDSELATAFAQAAGIPVVQSVAQMLRGVGSGDCLLVWEGLRAALQNADIGKWRSRLQQFENEYAVPLLAALSAGLVEQITLDVLSEGASRRYVLTRAARWKLWRLPKPLLHYALVTH
ncbi:MAG TPA: hypothetical protein VMV48_07180 [Gallionellaceae bacterium]|nr:hypothetical protein [Gallionellaceae bacterium]